MNYISFVTFLVYHNHALVYAISAQKGKEEDIESFARTICEDRGGIVSVYVNDDSAYSHGEVWNFSYINSGDRIWKVTQEDMWEWEDQWEMSEDFPYIGYNEPKAPRSRLEVGKWLIMGEQVREFLPGAKRAHKRETVRKMRRQERNIIQEQMM